MGLIPDKEVAWAHFNSFCLSTFCGPEPKAQVHYCCPSSERPSIRPSSVRRYYLSTFATSSLKPLNGIQRSLTGSMISTASTKFVFFGPIGKTRWQPRPLIRWYFFDFFSKNIERNSTKRDRNARSQYPLPRKSFVIILASVHNLV